jgi:ubiquinone/menaquinone biosynthesis C-methylase UbiE
MSQSSNQSPNSKLPNFQCSRGGFAPEGWHGWDAYAPFYDWENARTLGRRDVVFWQALARRAGGPILELGSGTGRVTVPVARVARTRLIAIDRSEAMLAYARRRVRRAGSTQQVSLVRGDIRALPFGSRAAFDLVMAPYGMLQSLVRDADLSAALRSIADVLAPGGLLGIDLVPDLSQWAEYRDRVRLRGFRRASRSHVTLVESVRQNRRRQVTIFDQVFIERRGSCRKRHTFSLMFRTLSIRQMRRRLDEMGLRVEAVLGDYAGGPWDPRADVWIILARKMER